MIDFKWIKGLQQCPSYILKTPMGRPIGEYILYGEQLKLVKLMSDMVPYTDISMKKTRLAGLESALNNPRCPNREGLAAEAYEIRKYIFGMKFPVSLKDWDIKPFEPTNSHQVMDLQSLESFAELEEAAFLELGLVPTGKILSAAELKNADPQVRFWSLSMPNCSPNRFLQKDELSGAYFITYKSCPETAQKNLDKLKLALRQATYGESNG